MRCRTGGPGRGPGKRPEGTPGRRGAKTLARWAAASFLTAVGCASANEIPVRISVKFILNAQGGRPVSGNLTTDAEVRAQVDRGNAVFAATDSEFRHDLIEIRDVSGAEGFFAEGLDAYAALRDAALLDPDRYRWRQDAINVYITAVDGSGVASFPPTNDFVMLCQGVNDLTLAHEIGHSLDLLHTHHDPTDHCEDTLPDDSEWTNRDQMAQAAFELDYHQLDSGQRELVDNTWGNLMSYHDVNNRNVLTAEQANRESGQGYRDRNWLLGKLPVYIRAGAPLHLFEDMGSWAYPYPDIHAAMELGEVAGRALVLVGPEHEAPVNVLDVRTDIVNRRSNAVVRDRPPDYQLPYMADASEHPAVRAAARRAQALDRKGDADGVLLALEEAAAAAKGRERHALELEIAQRLRDRGRYADAARWFRRVAEQTEQPALRERCLGQEEGVLQRRRQLRP